MLSSPCHLTLEDDWLMMWEVCGYWHSSVSNKQTRRHVGPIRHQQGVDK